MCVMFSCVFVTFPQGVSGQVWYMILLIPDLTLLLYLNMFNATNLILSSEVDLMVIMFINLKHLLESIILVINSKK